MQQRYGWFLFLLVPVWIVLARFALPSSHVLPAFGGGDIDLATLSDSENAVIFFWRGDCQTALDDLAALDKFAQTATNLRVVTVAMNTPPEDVPAWVTLPVALDLDGAYSAHADVAGTPMTLFLRWGVVKAGRFGGPVDFDEMYQDASGG
ncbi:MAG: hypothetical protein JXB47_01070 [Anaerolineae bacterium]|nr:hypothetical protein [Anaerolineae bacterium]